MNTQLLRTELRLFLREPASIAFGLAMAPLILVILGSIPTFRVVSDDLGGLRVIDLYVPIIMLMAIAMMAVNALPSELVTRRERGVLRRLSTTPVKASAMLSAQIVVHLLLTACAVLVILGLGRLLFDVRMPQNPVGFLLALVLSTLALFSIGLLIAGLFGTSRGAQGAGTLLFFPMLFFAGLWVPREAMPDLLNRIGDFTPLGAGAQAMRDTSDGGWPSALHLVVLLVYVVGVSAAAVRTFRWQ
ncbi:ABC transporter permease [Polymorphospora rubra]|uniref:ABC transporter permease n=1 Tax=Polymorphospora rubra TaxID=338584 RepID=UPI00340C1D42